VPVIAKEDVQQWLEATKYSVSSLDAKLEETARTQVFARLNALYNVGEWTTPGTTPNLVKVVVSMLVAAWTFNRAYAEDDLTESTYGMHLEARAWLLVDGILAGAVDIGVEIDPTLALDASVAFFPDDVATGRDNRWAAGFTTEEPDAPRAFTMGQQF
jgi:hypothetical protein